MWKRSVRPCAPCPLRSHTLACIHTPSAWPTMLSEVCPASRSVPMMFVPFKPEQLLRDLAPHAALSRSGTQWLLSCSLIPLWFILVLFAFPECHSACLTVLRSLPSPTLYQWITHPSTGATCCILSVWVCMLYSVVCLNSNGLFFQCDCRTSSSNTVLLFIQS